MRNSLTRQRPDVAFVVRIIGIVLFAYFFFGFMLLPCLNTLTSIFTTKNAAGEADPWAVIKFFFTHKAIADTRRIVKVECISAVQLLISHAYNPVTFG